jgi:hypothetical protein
MCTEIGVEVDKRQEALAGVRPDRAGPPQDQLPDHRGVRPR